MSNINVKVSGQGQLNIGNLAQGESINIDTRDMEFAERATGLVNELLEAARSAAAGDNSRFEAAQEKVRLLGEALAAHPSDNSKIKEILGLIKEHHAWAFPAVAAIAAKLAPALGALL